MGRKFKSKIILWGLSLLLVCLLGEVSVRACGSFDEDKNFFVGNLKVYPYRMPEHALKKKINAYLASNTSFIQYDPVLGWAPRPDARSEDGKYFYNSDAIRSASGSPSVSKLPPQGVLRIAIFGDSFTHGDDVPFSETWGSQLEEKLKKKGVVAEVLNFGVSGYGMDQALLRWRKEGRFYSPHIVIFGLTMENIHRNTNLIRAFYFQNTGIPFSKPRFILEGDHLQLVNSPTPLPQELASIIKNVSLWGNLKYENWYDLRDYRETLFSQSKLMAFLYSALNAIQSQSSRSSDKNAESLSLKIIKEFRLEVEYIRAKFYAVYLPSKIELHGLSNHEGKPAVPFLDHVRDFVPLIDCKKGVLSRGNKIATHGFLQIHYSPLGNQSVAESVAEYLMQQSDMKNQGRVAA